MDDTTKNAAQPSEDFLNVFKDRYSQIEFLSQGGMGKVFSAHDNTLDRKVAIKILSSSFEDDVALIRFQREAKTASKLNHPGIVQTLDFGITPKNFPYIIMDYVEGKSLDVILSEESKIPENLAVDIVGQVADAMAHAHSKEIIHRDLKTANIIVSNYPEDPKVTVIDFGLAKQEGQVDSGSRLTRVGSIIGTPLYMSPEQAAGNEGDERSDVYSLGCVAFKMLTGSTPFEGSETITLIKRKTEEEAPEFSSFDNTLALSDDLQSVIAKAIKRVPKDRQQSMKEFKEELTYSQTDKSLQTSAFAIPKFKNKNVEKSPLMALSIVLGLVVMFAVGSIVASGLINSDKKTEVKEPEFKPFPVKELSINEQGADRVRTFLVARASIKDTDLEKVKKAYSEYKPESKYKRIYGLNLKDTKIDGTGLASLIGVPIKRLNLSGTDLAPDSLQVIKDIRGLKSLIMKDSYVDDETLKNLKEAKNLTTLSLEGCKNFTSKGLAELADLNLRIINLVDTELDDEGVKELSKIKTLRRIHFDKTDITDDAFEILKDNKNIFDITITRCQNITKEGLEKIATNWPNLKYLDISDLNLTSEDLTPLHKLTKLRTLAVIYLPITDEDTKWISQNKDLFKLGIGKCDITDKGIEELTKLPITAFALYECDKVTKKAIWNARQKWAENLALKQQWRHGRGRKGKLKVSTSAITIIGDANDNEVIDPEMTGMFINSVD